MTHNVIANYTPRQTRFLPLHPLLFCFLRPNLQSYLFLPFGFWDSCHLEIRASVISLNVKHSPSLSKLNFQFDKCGNVMQLLVEIWIHCSCWERNIVLSGFGRIVIITLVCLKQINVFIISRCFVSQYESIKWSSHELSYMFFKGRILLFI